MVSRLHGIEVMTCMLMNFGTSRNHQVSDKKPRRQRSTLISDIHFALQLRSLIVGSRRVSREVILKTDA